MLDPVHQEGEEEPPLQQPCAAGALQRRRGPHWHVHDAGQHDGETQGTGKPQCVRVCLQLEEEACVDGPNRGEPHTYTYKSIITIHPALFSESQTLVYKEGDQP